MVTEYHCAKCGKILAENEKLCSSCGSSAKKMIHTIHDTAKAKDNIQAKAKNPDITGIAYKMTKKNKVSGKTKQPAEETMIIDRTHPEKTVKKHNVKEYDGQKWETVHDERQEYPTKRRRKH